MSRRCRKGLERPPGGRLEIWGDLGRYGEMWGDMPACRKAARAAAPTASHSGRLRACSGRVPGRFREGAGEGSDGAPRRRGCVPPPRLEMWGDVGRCGEIWGCVPPPRLEMWGDVGRCGEIWGCVPPRHLARRPPPEALPRRNRRRRGAGLTCCTRYDFNESLIQVNTPASGREDGVLRRACVAPREYEGLPGRYEDSGRPPSVQSAAAECVSSRALAGRQDSVFPLLALPGLRRPLPRGWARGLLARAARWRTPRREPRLAGGASGRAAGGGAGRAGRRRAHRPPPRRRPPRPRGPGAPRSSARRPPSTRRWPAAPRCLPPHLPHISRAFHEKMARCHSPRCPPTSPRHLPDISPTSPRHLPLSRASGSAETTPKRRGTGA